LRRSLMRAFRPMSSLVSRVTNSCERIQNMRAFRPMSSLVSRVTNSCERIQNMRAFRPMSSLVSRMPSHICLSLSPRPCVRSREHLWSQNHWRGEPLHLKHVFKDSSRAHSVCLLVDARLSLGSLSSCVVMSLDVS